MGFLTDKRRRRIVVDRSFQYKTALIGVLYIGATSAFLLFPLFDMMGHVETLLAAHPDNLSPFYERQKTFATVSSTLFTR